MPSLWNINFELDATEVDSVVNKLRASESVTDSEHVLEHDIPIRVVIYLVPPNLDILTFVK
jgi:hypothetical protein